MSDCCEKDDKGKLLPILMCYIGDKGIVLPNDILYEIKRHENKVYLYNRGCADFILSTEEI